MRFDPQVTAFGRHETFALRYGWLTKGFHQLLTTPNIFESEEATVRLGVGKNMVTSIKHWLKACQLVDSANQPTPLGNIIFDPQEGFDPYLEDEATIWLLHWLLATNPSHATAWYWFFNKFHKQIFSNEELANALTSFVEEDVSSRVSPKTIKSDVAVLTRMYKHSAEDRKQPAEEALDSPFSTLGLLIGNKRFTEVTTSFRDQLPVEIFAFSVAQLFDANSKVSISLDELMYCRNETMAPGAVFRLVESDVVHKLEMMSSLFPDSFQIRDVAGQLHVYQVEPISPEQILKEYYEQPSEGCAA